MFLKKKIQVINLYKFNNTGLDNVKELSSQNVFEYINGIQNGAVKNDLLAVIQPSPPPIASRRYLFNSSHVFSINQLIPLKKELQLRLNTDYVNDYQRQQSSVQTKIYLPTDTITINEQSQYRGNMNMLQGNLTLMANTTKYYLKNSLKFQGWWPDDKSYLDASSPIIQTLSNPKSFYPTEYSHTLYENKEKTNMKNSRTDTFCI